MNHQPNTLHRYDQFGQQIAARLSAGSADLEHDVLERLRVARQQALAKRKVAVAVTAGGASVSGGEAALHFNDDRGPGLWSRLATALPLMALVAGLLTIYATQNDIRADEVAEIDAALLTDDLPPAAYADPGFIQFLKVDSPAAQP
jgi:hypothetical protein